MANNLYNPTLGSGDAVCARARSEMYGYLNWLATNNVKGMIGEFGWPGSCQQNTDLNFDPGWDTVAQQVFLDMNASNLMTAYWCSAEWALDLRGYMTGDGNNHSYNYRQTNTSILEANYANGGTGIIRGTNMAGADFSDQGPSGVLNVSTIGIGYYYPSPGDWAVLAGRGVTFVRLPIRWERVQRILLGSLYTTDITDIKDALASANAAGIEVMIDIHNYGRYDTIGTGASGGVYDLGQNAPTATGGTMQEAYQNFWNQFATYFKGAPGLWGYDIMNEPHDLTNGVSTWVTASQNAVEAIRAVDQNCHIAVPGYFYDTVVGWVTQNGTTPWLTEIIPTGQTGAGLARNADPLIVFQGHHYWDNDNSGTFASTYATELSNATNQGYTSYTNTGYTAPSTGNTSQTGDRTLFTSGFNSQSDFSGQYDSIVTNSNTMVFPYTSLGNPGSSMQIGATSTSDTGGVSKGLTNKVYREYQVDFLLPVGATLVSNSTFAISHLWEDNDSTDLIELRILGTTGGYFAGLTVPSGTYVFVNSGATVLKLGVWNTLKIVITDTAINLYINGNTTAEATQTGTYTGINSGGFFCGKYYGTSYVGDMYFDNVICANSLTYYAPPNGGYLTPPAPAPAANNEGLMVFF